MAADQGSAPVGRGRCRGCGGPPVADRRPVRLSRHGTTWIDEYAWLRDMDDAEVMALLRAESAHAELHLAALDELAARLQTEFGQRPGQERLESVLRIGSRLYCWQHAAESDQPRLVRLDVGGGTGGRRAEPTVLLDLASVDGQLGELRVSPDERLLAYTATALGDERHEARVRPLLGTGGERTIAEGIGPTLAWAADSQHVLLTRLDDEWRPAWLELAPVDRAAPPKVLLHEADASFLLSVHPTTSSRYACVRAESQDADEVRLVDSTGSVGPPLVARRDGARCELDAHDRLLALTVSSEGRTRVLVGPPGGAPLHCAYQADEPVVVEAAQARGDEVVLVVRSGLARSIIAVEASGSRAVRTLVPPDVASLTLAPLLNPGPAADDVLHEHEGFLSPPRLRAVSWAEGEPAAMVGGAGPGAPESDYRCDHYEVTASDGALVPVTVLRAAGAGDRPAPLVLWAYGAYGASVAPVYMPFRLSLLDRGIGFALARIRGGGDDGQRWHEQGKGRRKPRGVDDYLECAHWLVDAGIAAPGGIVGRCGSAGAAVVGAAVNREPEVFACVVAEMPFVDCLATLLDESSPFTSFEWGEWGNPLRDSIDFEAIRSWSPYDNVRPVAYPPVIATAGWHDARVPPYEVARWVVRLRASSSSGAPVLLAVLDSGHDGHVDRSAEWHAEARLLAFVLEALALGRGAGGQRLG